MPGNCPAQFAPAVPQVPVENIPVQGERRSGRRQKVFAFPPEWVFAFRTECCSESQRKGVRLQTGIAFAFDRIPQEHYLNDQRPAFRERKKRKK